MFSKSYSVEKKIGVIFLLMLIWIVRPGAQDIATAANWPPTIVVPALATPSTVTGKTTTLTVLGADDGGASKLTYRWSAASIPCGAASPTFSVNSSNNASTTVATFSKAGDYVLKVVVTDASGLSASSVVSAKVLTNAFKPH